MSISRDVTEFEYGTEMALPCSVRGYPVPVIRWYKNNTPLPKSDRIRYCTTKTLNKVQNGRNSFLFRVIEESNTMVVQRATPIDGGVYTCRYVHALKHYFTYIYRVVRE